ncbi:hypothetical protein [Phyllobacterium chamaecytisi]|uniref:hypothetical protein n=1 Tax=Phyllobacterium chamaecytisi TaxID=2876082 RepID=UPI00351CCDC7
MPIPTQRVRKDDFGETAAGRLDNQPDGLAIAKIQQRHIDQPAVHSRVEQRVMNYVVDVSIDVIVGPAGLQPGKDTEMVALERLKTRHGYHAAR